MGATTKVRTYLPLSYQLQILLRCGGVPLLRSGVWGLHSGQSVPPSLDTAKCSGRILACCKHL